MSIGLGIAWSFLIAMQMWFLRFSNLSVCYTMSTQAVQWKHHISIEAASVISVYTWCVQSRLQVWDSMRKAANIKLTLTLYLMPPFCGLLLLSEFTLYFGMNWTALQRNGKHGMENIIVCCSMFVDEPIFMTGFVLIDDEMFLQAVL